MKTNSKIELEKIKASEFLASVGASNLLPKAFAEIEHRHRVRKARIQIIVFITIVILLFSAFWTAATAQTTQASAMVGYKSIELSYAYEAESELIFGGAISATSSDMTEKRANNNDKGKRHEFEGDVTPAVFGLIGAKFDDLYIIGKIGGSYVDQTINGEPTKDLFFALGVAIEYKISGAIGLRGSYDSVAGPMAGLTFHFNN
jgi:hypothetical protein